MPSFYADLACCSILLKQVFMVSPTPRFVLPFIGDLNHAGTDQHHDYAECKASKFDPVMHREERTQADQAKRG
jgi:hypothetical protein